ncbi:putative siderophore transport system permease protein YfiZ [Halomonadaceae bacterium LMG 33818]|uniref:FecCD family ABC transporter permease n=1 Tax=Cernens ardua TaxID=3402176 RepID=UPI003EDC92F9
MSELPLVRRRFFSNYGILKFARQPKASFIIVTCLLVSVTLLEVLQGSGEISARPLLSSLWQDNEDALYVLGELRLPRLWAGLLAGVSLGVAGYLVQVITKNPLADPDLLGVTPAALVLVAFSMFMGVTLAMAQVWIASLGALFTLGTMMIVFREHREGSRIRNGMMGTSSNDPLRLVLAGAALKGTLMAFTAILLLLDQHTADEMRFWVMGSIAGSSRTQISTVLIPFSVGILLVIGGARFFPALILNEEMTRSLGYRPAWIRAVALTAIALLSGVSVVLAGPISFLGMLVPTMARRLLGMQSRYMLPMCALLGALLLLMADTCARNVAPPSEQPLNLVMALLGAPFLISVVYRRRGGGSYRKHIYTQNGMSGKKGTDPEIDIDHEKDTEAETGIDRITS